MVKWLILHFKNPQNWFHVKSEWYKNHDIFHTVRLNKIKILGPHFHKNCTCNLPKVDQKSIFQKFKLIEFFCMNLKLTCNLGDESIGSQYCITIFSWTRSLRSYPSYFELEKVPQTSNNCISSRHLSSKLG